MEELTDLAQDIKVKFQCQTCGRTLAERYLREELFEEAEFRKRRTAPHLVVEDRLGSRKGNETVDWPQDRSLRGRGRRSILGINKHVAPRSDARLWQAEYVDNGVLVHITCGCGRDIAMLLSKLVEAAERASTASSPPPFHVGI
jgi:hypothetical protein